MTKKYRAKLYRDKKTNKLKGDGVITYFHEMSANMAVKLKHGATLESGQKLTVQMAKFEMKGNKYEAKQKAKSLSERKVEHAKFLAGKMQRVPFLKICIMKNMFSVEEAKDHAEGEDKFYKDLHAEILAEVKKIGEPKKITVFRDSPE